MDQRYARWETLIAWRMRRLRTSLRAALHDESDELVVRPEQRMKEES